MTALPQNVTAGRSPIRAAILDAQDIAALRATAEYLGGRYGRQNVGRFVKDKITEVAP